MFLIVEGSDLVFIIGQKKKKQFTNLAKPQKIFKMSEPSHTSSNGSHLLWTNPPMDSNDKL